MIVGRGPVAPAALVRVAASVLVAVVVVGLPAAGCGRQAAVLDRATTEAEVARVLRRAHPGVEVGRVTCPSGLRVEVGGRFRCGARLAGEVVEVDVRQRDDEGRLDVAPRSAVVVRDRVEEELLAGLADRLASESPRVACPGPEVRVVEPDTASASWECTVTDGRTRREVRVTVRDASGSLSFEIL